MAKILGGKAFWDWYVPPAEVVEKARKEEAERLQRREAARQGFRERLSAAREALDMSVEELG